MVLEKEDDFFLGLLRGNIDYNLDGIGGGFIGFDWEGV